MANAYPEVDPATGRVINPEKYSPEEVRRAQQLAGNQVGLAVMTDDMMHQAAKYDAEHQNYIAQKMLAAGMDSPKIRAMEMATAEVTYQRMKKKQAKG